MYYVGTNHIFVTSTILMIFCLFSVSTQDIQIQAIPPTVTLQANDLVIECSVTNPTQLSTIYYIQLFRNTSTDFEVVVSALSGPADPVQWTDMSLRNRASATGSVTPSNSPKLRLTIDKTEIECPADFKMYMCKLSGLSSTTFKVITKETNPITISYIGMYFFHMKFKMYILQA